MITQLFLEFFAALVTLALDALPTVGPPSWVGDAEGALAAVWDAGAGLGAWIPWTVVGVVFATLMGCVLLGFTIKVVRIVASYLTLGGGSAG